MTLGGNNIICMRQKRFSAKKSEKNAFLRLKKTRKHVLASMVVESFKILLKSWDHGWKALESSFLMVLSKKSWLHEHINKKTQNVQKTQVKTFCRKKCYRRFLAIFSMFVIHWAVLKNMGIFVTSRGTFSCVWCMVYL